MIAESVATLPIWMILSATFGFYAGELCGDYYRHRSCLEQTNEGLRAELEKAHTSESPSTVLDEIRDSIRDNVVETKALHRTLRHQRGAVNDIHQYIMAVSKGSGKPAA